MARLIPKMFYSFRLREKNRLLLNRYDDLRNVITASRKTALSGTLVVVSRIVTTSFFRFWFFWLA